MSPTTASTRLVVKTLDGNGTRYSMYSLAGNLVHEQIDGANREYYYLGSQLVAQQGAGAKTFIHPDILGSSAAKSNSSGSVISRNRHTPYGLDWGKTTGEAGVNEIGYTGHKHDSDIGLTYMQARYYDPVIGRFYSNDPVDAVSHLSNEEGIKGFNRYSYAVNNPYKYTDPDGKAICGGICIGVAIIAAKVGPKIYKAYKTYKSNKRIQKVLKNKQSTGKKGEQTSSSGSKGADKDFKTLTKGSDVKTYENGTKVGKTPDGRTVDKHGSSGKSGKGADVKKGTDSIKIKNESGKTKTTIRYPEN
jgi:RHS repeat-associated protein